MGSSDKFCLRWNEFESNMSAAFGAIRDDGDFFDVRLACEDGSKQIPAHRIVLSACSDFFRTVLRGMGSGRISASGQNPVLYLRGVTYTDLEAVLNFMYHGEANVAQNDLNNFLAVAEELCVKGLTGDDQKSAKPAASAKSSPPVSGSSGIKRGPGRPPGPLTKRPKMAVDSGNSGLKVKSEISPVGPAEDDFDEDAEGGGGDYSGTEGFDDSGGGGGGEYGEIDPIAGTSGRGGGSSGVDDSKDMMLTHRVPGDFVARAPRDLLRIIPGTRPTERVCLGCGKLFTDTSNARRHVRRMHLERPHDRFYNEDWVRARVDRTAVAANIELVEGMEEEGCLKAEEEEEEGDDAISVNPEFADDDDPSSFVHCD